MSAAWHLDACCVLPLLLSGAFYALGLAKLWGRAGRGRGVTPLQVGGFAGGWLVVALSVLSPLHAIGIRVFALHMAEHELLMVVAAPLFVLARPAPVFLWALPISARRIVRTAVRGRAARGLWHGLTDTTHAALLHGAAIWFWHLPGLFERALFSEPMHALQHLCFLLSALLFWWGIMSRERQRHTALAGVIALFATALHTSLLGALLTFAQGLWYPAALDPFPICGLTRGEDQQLAGLVMWVPSGLAYLAAALWLLAGRLMAEPGGRDAVARA